MLTAEEHKFEVQNAYDILNKYMHNSNKTININEILKDFKVDLQKIKEYEKTKNKKLIKFGIIYDEKYKPFYQSVVNLKEEHYFVYGLLAHFFRRNFYVNEENELLLICVSFEQFKSYFEKNYKEEIKFIKKNFFDLFAAYESLYEAYLLLEKNFVERYCLLTLELN